MTNSCRKPTSIIACASVHSTKKVGGLAHPLLPHLSQKAFLSRFLHLQGCMCGFTNPCIHVFHTHPRPSIVPPTTVNLIASTTSLITCRRKAKKALGSRRNTIPSEPMDVCAHPLEGEIFQLLDQDLRVFFTV